MRSLDFARDDKTGALVVAPFVVESHLREKPVSSNLRRDIEALFFLCFIALLIQALIERELRRAMKREQIDSLPLYPEERACPRPTMLKLPVNRNRK